METGKISRTPEQISIIGHIPARPLKRLVRLEPLESPLDALCEHLVVMRYGIVKIMYCFIDFLREEVHAWTQTTLGQQLHIPP